MYLTDACSKNLAEVRNAKEVQMYIGGGALILIIVLLIIFL